MIEENSIFKRNQGLIDSLIDSETVILSIENGNYYGLNAIASRIWELLNNPISFADLCRILIAEFSVSTEQCREEVSDFLEHLRSNDLILLK